MDITAKIYNDEDAAREHLEATLWPNGAVCPKCQGKNVTKLQGASTRPGVWKCRDCRKPFTVTVGTVFERSHIPLHKWVLASHLMATSKKGVSSHQLYRTLGFGSYKTAWFMAHRLREAMKMTDQEPFGDDGGDVEVDETYIGHKPGSEVKQGGSSHKHAIMTLIDRDTGRAHSRVIAQFNFNTAAELLSEAVSPKAHLHTDQATSYKGPGRWFASHVTVNHSLDEYVRYENGKR
jgi:transposase-like protein